MDRETLMQAIVAGPIRVTMNTGQEFEIPSRDHAIVDSIATSRFETICQRIVKDGAYTVGYPLHAILRDPVGDGELMVISRKCRLNG